jgi:hypothetical protein
MVGLNGRMKTENFKMAMETIPQDSMFSQVVIMVTMVVSEILGAVLSAGVLATSPFRVS